MCIKSNASGQYFCVRNNPAILKIFKIERTKKPINKPGHLYLNGKGNTKMAAKNKAVASNPSQPPAIFTVAPEPEITSFATLTEYPNKFNKAPPAAA